VENVMINSPATKAIRQRMEEVRCDLDEDVQEIVEGARGMGEWRTYVRAYPWVCMGAALAAGYLIVPSSLAGLASSSRSLEAPKGHARRMLLAFVGNLVVRGVSAYALQQAGKLFAAQAAQPPQVEQP
jgi:hypothetical protein